MGTFVGMYKDDNAYIPDDRLDEFEERLEKVLQAGGMMSISSVELLGIKVLVLQKAKRQGNGDMEFWYNYFEQDSWEEAGYDKERRKVWSNKVGWSKFNRAMCAAYSLQGMYTEGLTATEYDGEIVSDVPFVGWFNYLFDEVKNVKNYDVWPLFVKYHDPGTKYSYKWTNRYRFTSRGYSYINRYEIMAVERGVDYMMVRIEEPNTDSNAHIAYEGIVKLVTAVRNYVKDSPDDDKFEVLLELVKKHCQKGSKEYSCDYEGDLKEVSKGLLRSDSPAIALKTIAEAFDKYFWELWEEVKDVYKRNLDVMYGAENSYLIPLSTEELFDLEQDDLILYWEKGKTKLSEEFWEFADGVKKQWEDILKKEGSSSFSVKYLLEIMERLYLDYGKLMVIEDFFVETLNNMADKRYFALWNVLAVMMDDTDLINEINELFEDNGALKKDMWGNESKVLRVKSLALGKGVSRNAGREKLRKYIALVGNRELRKKVFGF